MKIPTHQLTVTGMIHNEISMKNSIFACRVENDPRPFMFLYMIRYGRPVDTVSFSYNFPKSTTQRYISPHLTYLGTLRKK